MARLEAPVEEFAVLIMANLIGSYIREKGPADGMLESISVINAAKSLSNLDEDTMIKLNRRMLEIAVSVDQAEGITDDAHERNMLLHLKLWGDKRT